MRECASLLRRMLNRIRAITDSFHLVLHTAPNTQHQSKALNYWRTIDEDYHWHIEILPILPEQRQKSYTFKETYRSAVMPEEAAARLREAHRAHGARKGHRAQQPEDHRPVRRRRFKTRSAGSSAGIQKVASVRRDILSRYRVVVAVGECPAGWATGKPDFQKSNNLRGWHVWPLKMGNN